jgi:hypothetical protein
MRARLVWRALRLRRTWIAALCAACFLLAWTQGAVAEGGETWISAGAAYSPTDWGGDQDGAAFVDVGVSTEVGTHWDLRGQAEHGRYTDYPDAGRVYFTLLGLGPRYRLRYGDAGAFLQGFPMIAASKWGAGDTGLSRVRVGVEVGAGVQVKMGRSTAVEVSAAWVRTDDFGSIPAADAPAPNLDALSVGLLRAELSIRLH